MKKGAKKTERTRSRTKASVTKKATGKSAQRAQEELFESDIFNSAHDGMVLMDCQTWNILEANPSFEKMSGFKKIELMGKKLWEVPSDENGDSLKRTFFELFQKGAFHLDHVPLMTKANDVLDVELNSTIIDSNGTKSMLCVCRPSNNGAQISTNSSIVHVMQGGGLKLEQFSMELLENANLIVIFINTEGEISLFNRKAESFSGMNSCDVCGKKFYDVLIAPKARSKVKEKLEEMLNGSEFIESGEYPIRNKQGHERLVSWRNSLITDSHNGVLGVLCIGEDVTEKKVMERRLKLYSDAIKSSIDSMIITDMNGYIIYTNRAAETVYGYSQNELLGKNYNIFSPTDDPPNFNGILQHLGGHESWEGEQTHLKKDGSRLSIYQTISLIKDEFNKTIAIMAVGRDISNTKKLNDELTSAKHLSEFYLDILTRDMNNINQGILGQLEQLKHGARIGGREQQQIEFTINHLRMGISLINNVNKLKEIEVKPKKFSHFDLTPILEFCFKRVEKKYPGRKLRLWGNFQQNKFKINVDDFIYELFTNLMDNAVKFDAHVPVEIGINVSRIKRNSKDFIKINILDRGRGIPPAERKRIFERYQGPKGISNRTGLGLSIVKTLIDRYHGEIWLEERVPGDYTKGSVFCIALPTI